MKKRILLILLSFCGFQTTFAVLPWSQRMANSVILNSPNYYGFTWDYVNGVVMGGFQALYKKTNNTTYFNYIQSTVKAEMNYFNSATKTLDNVKEGTALLFMYENTTSSTDKTSYQNKLSTIRTLLDKSGISRTTEGGFWHKDSNYAWQMWGDGLYMAEPFYAQYSTIFNNSDSTDFADIANQFILFESHARDASTGLLYHGWSERPTDSRSSAWADTTTGCSASFWGRAMGWYVMGLVDVLDYFPKNHPRYNDLVNILKRLVPAIVSVQDPSSGCWYDVVDQGTRCSSANSSQCNYLESSASCMFAYAILKAVRLGYVDNSYLSAGTKAYEGILNTFVTTSTNTSGETVIISNNCQVSGLGGSANRSGKFDYYMSEPVVTTAVDGKPIGPFILASLEYESLTETATQKLQKESVSFYLDNANKLHISCANANDNNISINVFDLNGREQAKLQDEALSSGTYNKEFSLSMLKPGTYIVQLNKDEQQFTQKINIR